jgi:hypothetical protein|tara:strand:- start:354 stop:569 length:216 start_codon:yes stop_codon:yes gene_type:complete
MLTTGNKEKMFGNTNNGRKVASGNDNQDIRRILQLRDIMNDDNKNEVEQEIRQLKEGLSPEGKLKLETMTG